MGPIQSSSSRINASTVVITTDSASLTISCRNRVRHDPLQIIIIVLAAPRHNNTNRIPTVPLIQTNYRPFVNVCTLNSRKVPIFPNDSKTCQFPRSQHGSTHDNHGRPSLLKGSDGVAAGFRAADVQSPQCLAHRQHRKSTVGDLRPRDDSTISAWTCLRDEPGSRR